MNKLTYVLIALTAIIGFLIVAAPANLVLGSVVEKVSENVPDLRLGNLSGSVWSGSGAVQYLSLPPAAVNWTLAPLPLVTGAADTRFDLEAVGLNAAGEGIFTSDGGSITGLEARVDGAYLNQLTAPLGLNFTGHFSLAPTNVTFTPRWIESINGELNWHGGQVQIETPGEFISADLPPLLGQLSMDDQTLVLQVTADEVPMIDVRVQPDGWAAVAINFAFVDLAGISLPAEAVGAGDPAILLEEKIF